MQVTTRNPLEITAKKIQVSARNALEGIITNIEVGTVNTEVTIEITPGIEVTSVITKASAENLQLSLGKQVYAIIKSSDVMLAVD